MKGKEVIGEENICLVTVAGRTYRKRTDIRQTNFTLGHFMKMKDYEEDDEPELDDFQDIKQTSTGMYITYMDVASVFYPFIIGKKGHVKQRIEKETKTEIIIPPANSDSEEISILGATKTSILNTRTRIEIICETAANSLPYTHFICIPLQNETLMKNISTWQEEIVQEAQKHPIEGFDKTILQPTKHLHLTILMLKLFTQKDIDQATSILQELKPKIYDILNTRTLMVKFKGLEIMNDDPSQVDVLYLQVHETELGDRLEKLTKLIVDTYKGYSMVTEEQDKKVKLHATLMNTRYRRPEQEEKYQRERFNAHGIITKYENIDFGTYRLENIHLSQRGAFDKTGFYQSLEKRLL